MLHAINTQRFGIFSEYLTVRLLVRTVVVVLLTIVAVLLLDWTFRSNTYPVKTVEFKGAFTHVNRKQLESVVAPYLRNNYLMLDLNALRQDLENIPWIYRASVRRKWPAGLSIVYTEQSLVARWGREEWLNSQGDVVRVNSDLPTTHMPFLTGPAAESRLVLERYREYSELLGEVGLQLTEVTLSDRQSWRLKTESGMEIILGKDQAGQRLKRFLSVYRQVLAGGHQGFSRVDLRYTNGFAVKIHQQAEALTNTQFAQNSRRQYVEERR